jgi:HisJ family histidinol phosphate phosphatase
MADTFVWETHGIHVGTGGDHLSHGIDDLEAIVERAITRGFPSVTFVVHTPRLTRFRYAAERETDVKFIRGYAAYAAAADRIAGLRDMFRDRIRVRWGVELEWLGTGLGLAWSRAKLFQAHGADFVIASVHFSAEGIPYDGSPEDTARLIEVRGGIEPFWERYFDEVADMLDAAWQMISVVGHLDLPRRYAPPPRCLADLDRADDDVARRLFTVLGMVAERGLALDLNLAGVRHGIGAYPDPAILRHARRLSIPIAIGSDTHHPDELGADYAEGVRLAAAAGYRYYVSFARGIPEKRPLEIGRIARDGAAFRTLNLAIGMLNSRLPRAQAKEVPRLSFGGGFAALSDVFPEASSLGGLHAVRAWKSDHSVTVSDRLPAHPQEEISCLFSHHADTPGTLATLLNTLASEEINVRTAWLHPLEDGTATAYLTLDAPPERVTEAVAFVLGTAPDRFHRIEPCARMRLPPPKPAPAYLLEVDGVWLPMPLSHHMVLTVHANRSGVLLVLLSALASRKVNVLDLQLGERGDKGYAALGVEGDERDVASLLPMLGPGYLEAVQVLLPDPRD